MKKLVTQSKDLWQTPAYLYDGLDEEFKFTLDAAATPENTKCPDFLSEKDNALDCDWSAFDTGNVFLNPPYSKSAGGLLLWAEKAYEQSQKLKVSVVCVMIGDTSTKYRKFGCKYASEIRDLTHRVKFMGAGGTPQWATSIYVFRPIKFRVSEGAMINLWAYK